MLYINSKDRASISLFRTRMYNYIKENKLRYSDQRERVLKIMHMQNYPVSVDFLVKKLNKQTLGASYATVSRHIKLLEKLDMLIVVLKSQKGYLLKKSVDNCDVEVVIYDTN